jgi:hypothetical protein
MSTNAMDDPQRDKPTRARDEPNRANDLTDKEAPILA